MNYPGFISKKIHIGKFLICTRNYIRVRKLFTSTELLFKQNISTCQNISLSTGIFLDPIPGLISGLGRTDISHSRNQERIQRTIEIFTRLLYKYKTYLFKNEKF
jgi:hypothetical protein